MSKIPICSLVFVICCSFWGSAFSYGEEQGIDFETILQLRQGKMNETAVRKLYACFASEKEFTKAVVGGLASENEDMRSLVLDFLDRLDRPEIVHQTEVANEIRKLAKIEQFTSESVEENHCVKAMNLIGQYRLPDAFELLENNMFHYSERVRVTAIHTVGRFGSSVPQRTIERLIETLDDEGYYHFPMTIDMAVPRYVVEDTLMTIRKIGSEAQIAVPRLRKLAKSKSKSKKRIVKYHIPFLCAEISVRISPRKNWGGNFLQNKLDRGKKQQRIYAAECLSGLISTHFNGVAVLEQAYQNEESTDVKNVILKSLLQSELSKDECEKYAKLFLEQIIESIKDDGQFLPPEDLLSETEDIMRQKRVEILDLPTSGFWLGSIRSSTIDLVDLRILLDYQLNHAEIIVPLLRENLKHHESLYEEKNPWGGAKTVKDALHLFETYQKETNK